MTNFDLIVVGAGTGGAMTAKTATKSGLEVCLVDRKRRPEIGDKICGDAIGVHHFDNLGLAYPKGDELAREIEGIEVFSPNEKAVFSMKGKGLHGFIINRLEFGQRILTEALDAGASLLDEHVATNLILKEGKAAGIISKDLKSSSTEEIYGKIVVDASGHASTLRSKAPPDWMIQSTIGNDEVMACYREIREVSTPIESAQFCKIFLNQTAAPGGYSWIFPKGANTVNVGLGVQMKAGFPNPKKRLYDNVLSTPFFAGSKALSGGGGLAPTRRPIDCMVGEGFMLVGDSACQVNPIHGGGIGPSMTAGKIAAEVAAKSLEEGDCTTRSLWPYNSSYMKAYGYKQAGLDLFRIFLQKIGNDLIDYGMENVLIKEEDVLKVTSGEELHLNVTEKAERILRGLGKISLVIRLRELSILMKEMKNYYSNYPSLDDYADWKMRVERFYEKAKEI